MEKPIKASNINQVNMLVLFCLSSSLFTKEKTNRGFLFFAMPKSSRWVNHRAPSKTKKLILFLLVAFVYYIYRYPSSSSTVEQSSSSIYNISVKDIEGKDVSLSKFTGKVLLIVNVASKCGLTHGNYKELNILYAKYKSKGLEILAFPCNQFGSQEPGSNKEIKETVCNIFKAEFPIFDKIDVNGKNTSPLYNFLKEQKGGLFGDSIKWNFAKFLVDKQGNVVDRYAPTTSPLEIEMDIVKLLESA